MHRTAQRNAGVIKSVSECGYERERDYMWGERAFMRECESVLLRMCGVRVWSGGHTRMCIRKWGPRRVHETANSGRLGVDKCGHENAHVYHRE